MEYEVAPRGGEFEVRDLDKGREPVDAFVEFFDLWQPMSRVDRSRRGRAVTTSRCSDCSARPLIQLRRVGRL